MLGSLKKPSFKYKEGRVEEIPACEAKHYFFISWVGEQWFHDEPELHKQGNWGRVAEEVVLYKAQQDIAIKESSKPV